MCYEPLRFSPIFRRFVNSRESRVGSPLTPLNLTTKKRVTYTLSSFVLWCVLDRFTRSRAFPRTTPPSAYTKIIKPLLFEPLSTTREKSSRLEVPSRGGLHRGGLHRKTNTRPKPGCRVYTIAHPQIYRISVRSSSTLEGVLSSRLVVRLHACVLSRLGVAARPSLYIHALCPSLRLLFLSPFSLSSSSSFSPYACKASLSQIR